MKSSVQRVPMWVKMLAVAYTFVFNAYVVGLFIYGAEYVLRLVHHPYSVLPYMAKMGITNHFLAYVGAGAVVSIVGVVIAVSGLGEVFSRASAGWSAMPKEYRPYMDGVFRRVLADAHWEGKAPSLYLTRSFRNGPPNAANCGTSIAVNAYAIENLDQDYLKVLIAHELGHLVNGDGRVVELIKCVGWGISAVSAVLQGITLLLRSLFFAIAPASIFGLAIAIPLIVVECALFGVDRLYYVFTLFTRALAREMELDADRYAAYIYKMRAVEFREMFLRVQQEAEANGILYNGDPRLESHPREEERLRATKEIVYGSLYTEHAPVESTDTEEKPVEQIGFKPPQESKIIYVKPNRKEA